MREYVAEPDGLAHRDGQLGCENTAAVLPAQRVIWKCDHSPWCRR
jgi:hypothetical protein